MNSVSNLFVKKIWHSLLMCLSISMVSQPAPGQISIMDRYWQYKGEPVLFVSGSGHGHNPFIDHQMTTPDDGRDVSTEAEVIAHMDEMVGVGGNYLRCVLNPGMAHGIQGFRFCAKSGDKADLNTMTGAFWSRLELFISEAEKRNVVVQLEIWDRFDLIDGSWQSWPVSPFNPKNNRNYTSAQSGLKTSYKSFKQHPFLKGVPGHPDYESASASRKAQYDLVRGFQEKFIDKLISITFKYDNVLYCMNNETHEHPAWGKYWIKYIRNKADSRGKKILLTDMFLSINADKVRNIYNSDVYDYVDISQVNGNAPGEDHWDRVKGMIDAAGEVHKLLHMTKMYGADTAPGKWEGNTDNVIGEMWRGLIAGVACARFHRPPWGLGLTTQAKSCIAAVRKIESKVKFWDVEPRLDLLKNRQTDEAYLAANPGQAYILYFTAGGSGSVGLDLTDHANKDFDLSWVDIGSGEWGATATVSGGSTVTINRPGPGHWAAAIVR